MMARKQLKIGKPYVGLIMEVFEEVQVQNKKKNTRKLFYCKKSIRDKENRAFTLKNPGNSEKEALKNGGTSRV